MASEKRLIDANRLREVLLVYLKSTHDMDEFVFDNCFPYWIVSKAIKTAPTVDAVEVVRCKDCVYNENGCCTHSEYYDDTRYRPDYFCADGERKDNEN